MIFLNLIKCNIFILTEYPWKQLDCQYLVIITLLRMPLLRPPFTKEQLAMQNNNNNKRKMWQQNKNKQQQQPNQQQINI